MSKKFIVVSLIFVFLLTSCALDAESKMIAARMLAPRPSEEEVQKAFEAEMTRIAILELTPPPPTITPQLGILPPTHLAYQIQLPRQVLVENIWQGYINDNLSLVYAGQLWPDVRTGNQTITYHGVIAVTTSFADGTFRTKLYITDDEVGSLTIQEVTQKGEMILISEGYQERASETIYFDLSSETFGKP